MRCEILVLNEELTANLAEVFSAFNSPFAVFSVVAVVLVKRLGGEEGFGADITGPLGGMKANYVSNHSFAAFVLGRTGGTVKALEMQDTEIN